ncbi:hypothetical protein GCM10022393_38530 [Aquimarina addita]|uniref:Uncharacterized protein n=1 Tax=Aquimarina addita TaxID=870485 RepID=A0ABP6UWH0_9FLAO
MENKKALKLIDKILTDLEQSGINTTTLITDLTSLRSYALEQQVPLVVKVLRLTCEHIVENDSFLIPIPDDEPIEENEGEVIEKEETPFDPTESLIYLVSLFKDIKNKMNVMDLGEYRNGLLAS